MIAVTAVSGIGGVIATRALGPYERGLLATAMVWATVMGSLVAYGIPQVGTYFVARERVERARFASTLLAMGATAGLAVAALGITVSLVLVRSEAAEPMAIAFAAQLPVILAGAGVGAILGLGEYRAWGLFRLLGPAIALAGIIAVTSAGFRTAVVIAAVTAVAVSIQTGVLLAAMRRRHLVTRPSLALIGPILSYMWRTLVSGAARLVPYKLDQLFLSVAVAPQLLGIYAVAASFVDVIVPIAASAGQVMLTRVSADGGRAIRVSLPRALVSCLLVAGGCAAATFVAAPLLVPLLFGDQFLPSATPVRILVIGAIALAVSSVFADTLRGLGRPLVPAKADLIGGIATLILLLALVPSFGVVGAAIASTASYLLAMVAMGLYMNKEMRRGVPPDTHPVGSGPPVVER